MFSGTWNSKQSTYHLQQKTSTGARTNLAPVLCSLPACKAMDDAWPEPQGLLCSRLLNVDRQGTVNRLEHQHRAGSFSATRIDEPVMGEGRTPSGVRDPIESWFSSPRHRSHRMFIHFRATSNEKEVQGADAIVPIDHDVGLESPCCVPGDWRQTNASHGGQGVFGATTQQAGIWRLLRCWLSG